MKLKQIISKLFVKIIKLYDALLCDHKREVELRAVSKYSGEET